ncbi:hypothetical protein TELCIR_16932 [Teladorsagia circumcincta]|uniref:Uncharacterized protein n=1 Tax=Teladorsagia circumcincta TaxID=45464 RepID=A0A2G9TU83_TELCI|nr:hypothetical protein TELCIR_16932 [Teladorsagia circumcincta]
MMEFDEKALYTLLAMLLTGLLMDIVGAAINMRQSIVVKARVDDMEQAENAIFDLTESLGTFFVQEDVYFNVPNGNLKLRIMHPNRCGQLIYNSLSEKSNHKLSESQVTEVEDVLSIRRYNDQENGQHE